MRHYSPYGIVLIFPPFFFWGNVFSRREGMCDRKVCQVVSTFIHITPLQCRNVIKCFTEESLISFFLANLHHKGILWSMGFLIIKMEKCSLGLIVRCWTHARVCVQKRKKKSHSCASWNENESRNRGKQLGKTLESQFFFCSNNNKKNYENKLCISRCVWLCVCVLFVSCILYKRAGRVTEAVELRCISLNVRDD